MVKLLNPQKHSDQRLRLLSHARRLFAANGVKETSMSQIAKACKVTKAALYHYFKSKEDILKEILQLCAQEKENSLGMKLTQARNLEESFYGLARHHLEQMEKSENLEIMKILLSETMKNSEMKDFFMALTNENLQKGAQEILGPMVRGEKTEKELRLLFFQFLATLMHYTWHVKMVGDISGTIGDDEAFARQLAKTYALAVQTP